MTSTRMVSVPARLLSVMFLITLLPMWLSAQDSARGAIRGTVVDASGGRIAQASIVVVNSATGTR